MHLGQLLEHLCAPEGELEVVAAPVVGIGRAFEQSGGDRPLDQLGDRMVPLLERLGHVADGRPTRTREAPHRQQQLVLGRGEPSGPCRGLGEAEEAAQLVAERGEGLVLAVRQGHGASGGPSLHTSSSPLPPAMSEPGWTRSRHGTSRMTAKASLSGPSAHAGMMAGS